MIDRITEQPFCQTRDSGSALIADFLGWENYGDGKTYKFPNLYPIYNIEDEENTGWISEQISKAEFDTRWDWLMPVVDKLMRTKIGDGVEYVEYPYLRTFGMINEETKNPMVRFNGFQVFEAETLIEATFLAVVDFLEWWSKADRYRFRAWRSCRNEKLNRRTKLKN